jgi:hypothetical protein
MKLSQKAHEWLTASNCFEEICDDMLTLAESGIQILLSQKAVQDLNRQAREQDQS